MAWPVSLKWCSRDSQAAIAHWHAGLGAPYAVGAVGIHLPLLLLLGSILTPGSFPKDEAERLLALRISDPRARSWPRPLGQFVLGQIDGAAMEASWIGSRGKGVRGLLPHLKWLTEFYKLVLQLARGDLTLSSYQESMRHMVDTSLPEWSEESDFLSLLWNEEFYLGRDKASRKPDHNSLFFAALADGLESSWQMRPSEMLGRSCVASRCLCIALFPFPRSYPHWYVDEDGHIAHFANGGLRRLPFSVRGNSKAVERLERYFFEEAPVISTTLVRPGAEKDAKSVDVKQRARHVKAFAEVASKGLPSRDSWSKTLDFVAVSTAGLTPAQYCLGAGLY